MSPGKTDRSDDRKLGKENSPTQVKEPDNTRSPSEPTPRHSPKVPSVAEVENNGE